MIYLLYSSALHSTCGIPNKGIPQILIRQEAEMYGQAMTQLNNHSGRQRNEKIIHAKKKYDSNQYPRVHERENSVLVEWFPDSFRLPWCSSNVCGNPVYKNNVNIFIHC
jgi:hypothetical protein